MQSKKMPSRLCASFFVCSLPVALRKAIWCPALFAPFLSLAQEDTLARQKSLEEVIIYSNKFAERKKNIVQKIDVISARQIAQMNAQNTGDLLINTGNVFVQKSQQGGSSPVIRGFEASRVLLVVDGIRMNNAIFRSGHLQNIITVDQNMLERVEVLYGPASTLYGSDALGGVVHMRTKGPLLSSTGKSARTGSAFVRHSSANKEKTAHADFSIGGRKWGWLQSYTFSDFDDLRMGSRYPDKYPDFGRRTHYIAHLNGIDSLVTNKDDRVQKFSGYRQWDVMQKVVYRPARTVSHLLNLQYSGSGNVPRYDRLQDRSNGTLRFAEWYYGPQERQLAAYELNMDSSGFFTNIKSIISYQHIAESRHQREYRRYDRLDNRFENLQVGSFTLDGRKLWKKNELTVGIDGQWNSVKSTAFRKNIRTGSTSPLDARYPNGSNRMTYYGAYAQHLWKGFGNKLIINDGIRLQGVQLHSTIKDNSFFNFPFTQIDQKNTAVTGNIGLVYLPSAAWRLTGGLSSGFRSPNIDDAAKIFESNTASRQLILPNPGIKPEKTCNVDVGITGYFENLLNTRLEITGFYTWFRNALALAPFTFENKDSINYNGTMVRVFANQNVNKARLYGFNANLTTYFSGTLQLFTTVSYTYGRLKGLAKTEVPLDHIPPIYGKTSLTYSSRRVSIDGYILYNGWKKIADYHPSGEDNAQYATPEGTPAWATFNIKSTIVLARHLTVQAGIENIGDRNYRYFASGFSAPGRNLILSLRSSF